MNATYRGMRSKARAFYLNNKFAAILSSVQIEPKINAKENSNKYKTKNEIFEERNKIEIRKMNTFWHVKCVSMWRVHKFHENKRRIHICVRIETHNLLQHSDIFIWEKQKADKVCLWIFHLRCSIDSCVEVFMECFGLGWLISSQDFRGIYTHFLSLTERMWLLTRTRTHKHTCVVCGMPVQLRN